MTEANLLSVLSDLSGQSFDAQLQRWVHGTDDLPLQKLLESSGIRYEEESASRPDQLGLRVNEHNGIHIKSVLRGGAAEQAGFAASDEWLGIEVGQPKARQAWRLNKLDDLALYLGGASTFNALVARDQRLMTLQVTLPKAVDQVKLRAHDEAKVTAWLAGKTTQKK